ncbi:MAG: bifunctional acetate--CoA ligase family protein/GNAT family N-acetyltransferase [Planctomycetaceae bacterium]|nr:bifunctional acetate--CoA ligase family protein/GNAT family N-acetyltransferase [Planctomycetaceae bacterium]
MPKASLASNLLRTKENDGLQAFFSPQNIAVIGATEKPGSVGRTIVRNLLGSPFGGTISPVNPSRRRVLGIKAHPRVGDVPDAIDLAIVATPAPTVPDLIGECVEAGVRAAIIASSGYKETGAGGAELERRIMEQASRGRIRIIGPNSLGVMRPMIGLNASATNVTMARPGKIAFLSQSGALGAAMLDWSLRANVGFSAFVSVGSMLDVDWGDLIDYLGNDLHTKSIIIYMESIGDARSFLSAAREVALSKPIIVIKTGRTEEASRAAASHTGSLTGSDAVLNAAFHRCGVLRVDRISELFSMAEILNTQPRLKGPRLAILTNAGGPGVLATDALTAGGGQLAPLASESIEALNRILPPPWSHRNPVDLLGDAGPDRYAQALEVVAEDPNTDGLLVILTPQAMIDPTRTAEALKAHGTSAGKPVLASWMGGDEVVAGASILNRAGIPTFTCPDTATRAFNNMWRYSHNLRSPYETPALAGDENGVDHAGVEDLIASVLAAGRTLLNEAESKRLLESYRIPVVPTRVAATEEQAVALAEELGYPAVLKLDSRTIVHKTHVGGVQLNLTDAGAVRHAYRAIEESVRRRVGAEHFLGVTVQPMITLEGSELIIGSSPDPQLGPVLLFGAGGTLVELLMDRALGLPPLNTTLARRMMETTRIFQVLKGARGCPPVDLGALERLLVRFSRLVIEQPRIREIDINPLLATPERLIVLDARVVLHPAEVDGDQLPRPAICPYPTQYVAPWTAKNGPTVTIRPIRPEDEPLVVRFHEKLSEDSVYLRFFQSLKLSRRIAHERLARTCFIDYNREMALVAEHEDPRTGEREVIAMGRLSRLYGTDKAEFSLEVRDTFQRCGLGTEILRRLIAIGRDARLHCVCAVILPRNRGMLRICDRLGFHTHYRDSDQLMHAELDLTDTPRPSSLASIDARRAGPHRHGGIDGLSKSGVVSHVR